MSNVHHLIKDRFKRHGMTAEAAGLEEIASTMPLPFIVGHVVIAVIPGKNHIELFEYDPVSFLSVTLGFLNFADHS
jgi:hypothetical protein